MNFKGHFIGGEWTRREGGGHFCSMDPFQRDPVLEVTYGDGAEIDEAAERAAQAFPAWRSLSMDKRAGYLQNLRKALKGRKEELGDAICVEMGKTLTEARSEAQACIDKITVTLLEGRRLMDGFTPDGVPGACHFLPLGVMGVIGPYNFPAHLANGHIVPALLAGNTVVFKPSSVTPLVGQVYAEAMEAAELPPGVFNLVQVPRRLGDRLILHRAVRGVLFTGSYAVGRHLKALTLDDPWKLLALEMGGKNVAIVAADAHLDQAVAEVVMGAWLTTGQRCTRTARVLVDRTLVDEFQERLIDAARALQSGDPHQADTFMGPLASASIHREFMRSQRALEEDSAITTLVSPPDLEGNLVGAALHRMDELVPDHPYVRNEIFGPDLCIEPVESLEQAIRHANVTDYGLAMAVFSAERATYEAVMRQVQCGVVNWNRATIGASGKLPFGGLGKSGNHRPAGLWAAHYCTYPVAELHNPFGQVAEHPCQGFPLGALRRG